MKKLFILSVGLLISLVVTAVLPVNASQGEVLGYELNQAEETCYEDTGNLFDVPVYITALTQDTQRWTIIKGVPEGPQRMTSEEVDAIGPLPSPDGCWVVYLQGDFSADTPLAYHLLDMTCAPDCAGVPLPDEANELRDLRWSPDSTRLTGWDGNNTWVIDIEAETVEMVSSGNWNAFPAWSPDGASIILSSDLVAEDQQLSDDIQLIPADGGDYINLTYNGEFTEEIRPRWSPDGTHIAYNTRNLLSTDEDSSGFDLFVVDAEVCATEAADCIETRRQLSPAEHVVIDYAWSPDGAQIAYVAGNILTYQDQVGEIWVVDVASGELTQLTDQPTDGYVTWAPNGALILFQRSTEEELTVYGVRADGSDEAQIIFNGFLASAQPSWTPHWFYQFVAE